MAHWKKFFHSDFLGSHDMPETGEVNVTISSVKMEEVHNPETHEAEEKPVVRFKGAEKGWILNKTCAKVIGGKYGSEADTWVGKKVTLFKTTCDAFGEEVECVRVKID